MFYRYNGGMDKDGVDRISELPVHILHLILSRLPTTEDVIRTSILSKRWRHLWTSIPSVDLDYFRANKYKKFEFAELVYWVLANRSSDLESFCLRCCSDLFSMSTVGRWIHMAAMRRVKVVDLMICPTEWSDQDQWSRDIEVEVPNCLVTCGSLEVLRLSLFKCRLSLPKFTGLLRVLELTNVKLTDGGLVQHFLESCTSLEELSFIHCNLHELGYLSISCPKLKNLRIDNRNTDGYGFLYSGVWISCPQLVFMEFGGHIADSFSFKSLDSLKKAVIHPEDLDEYKISYDPRGDSMRSMFAQISHVEFMSLSHYFIKELDVQESLPNLKTLEVTTTLDADIMDALIKFLKCLPYLESLHLITQAHLIIQEELDVLESLPNLKTLEVTTTLDADIMDALIKFLKCFPHLESLHLIIQESYFTDKHWKLDDAAEEARRILAPCLKTVEFLEFKGESRKLVMVRSLLKYGNVLEKIVFNWGYACRHEPEKIMKKVSKFPKASSTVKLITLINE